MNTVILIVAAGSGLRMGSEIPKQFLPLGGKPVLAHTVGRFAAAQPGARIVVVLPADGFSHWEQETRKWLPGIRFEVCRGGENRFASVRAGLAVAGPCDQVLIHDGVRPLASEGLIIRVLECVAAYGSAVPVVEPVDSFRSIDATGSAPIERSTLRAVQTPQGFTYETIAEAYALPYHPGFTDDASVVEASGRRVTLCEGERLNIKITTPEDLAVAEALIAAKA